MRLYAGKGQNLIEFSIMLAIVVAVFTVMQVYIKRGIQGGLKFSADQLGKQEDFVEKDPTKGRLEEAISHDIVQGTSTVSSTGGTQTTVSSQTSTKGEGSHSLYKVGFTEGK